MLSWNATVQTHLLTWLFIWLRNFILQIWCNLSINILLLKFLKNIFLYGLFKMLLSATLQIQDKFFFWIKKNVNLLINSEKISSKSYQIKTHFINETYYISILSVYKDLHFSADKTVINFNIFWSLCVNTVLSKIYQGLSF